MTCASSHGEGRDKLRSPCAHSHLSSANVAGAPGFSPSSSYPFPASGPSRPSRPCQPASPPPGRPVQISQVHQHPLSRTLSPCHLTLHLIIYYFACVNTCEFCLPHKIEIPGGSLHFPSLLLIPCIPPCMTWCCA